LKAPIIINVNTRLALQVVSTNDEHDLQHEIALTRYPLREFGEVDKVG
jgi:flagellar assembly factor FliW